MKRVDLGIRLVQLQLCLDREKAAHPVSEIRPAEASRAHEALMSASKAGRLGKLDDPESRVIFWNALRAAHPMLRLYVEGVSLAGFVDDPDVIDETLYVLHSEWLEVSRSAGISKEVVIGRPRLEGWMVSALASLLRFQAVGEAADAGASIPPGMSRSERLAVEALWATDGNGLRTQDSAPGWQFERLLQDLVKRRDVRPIRTTVASAVDAAVTGRMDNFSRMARVAEALVRAGERSVEFWSTAAWKQVDADTDTIVETAVVVLRDKEQVAQGRARRLAIGPLYVLNSLAGKKVRGEEDYGVMAFEEVGDPKSPPTEGEYLYTGILRPDKIARSPETVDAWHLDDFLRRQGLFFVDIARLPEASRSPVVWAERFQGLTTGFAGYRAYHRYALGPFASLSSCRTFTHLAEKRSALQPSQAFRDWFFRWGTCLELWQVALPTKEDSERKLFLPRPRVSATPLISAETASDISQRSARDAELFATHEAALGRAIQAMPQKFHSVHPRICFRTASEVKHTDYVEGYGTSIRALGTAGRGSLTLSRPWVSTAVHEMLHCLNLLLYGDIAGLFSDVSWEMSPTDRKWVLRAGQASRKQENFFGESWAMKNPSEDHSFWGEYYFAYPEWLRQHVRAQAARGNFAPAVKYLYLKRISFLDFNGRSREYRLAPRILGDKPFSIEEFRRIAAGFRTLTPEQTRLRDLAERIEQTARRMVNTGKITCADPSGRHVPNMMGVSEQGKRTSSGLAWNP